MFNYLAVEVRPQFHRSYGSQQGVSGPLKSRLEQLKKPWWREATPLVLQHSETARLAIDAFLEQGERGYLSAIAEERELPFLSTLDMEYMSHQRNQSVPDPSAMKDKEADPGDVDTGDRSSLNSELTSGTYFPLMSDVHPPELELGWPGTPLLTVSGQTQATVIFQRNKANSIKDLLRSLISRARTVIAIVMDLFTDMEILCDLLEASSRRHVPVYLILDEEYLKHFVEMCNKMALTQDSFPHWLLQTAVAGQAEVCCVAEGTLPPPPGTPTTNAAPSPPRGKMAPAACAARTNCRGPSSFAGLILGRDELPTKGSASRGANNCYYGQKPHTAKKAPDGYREPYFPFCTGPSILQAEDVSEKFLAAFKRDEDQNMRIRCLSGDTYYSKAGKKFAGQVLEKFILIDCDQVLAGTYSFTWLCSQVHTSLVTHFRGQIVAEFDKEFRYLYAESRAVTSFCVPDPGTCPSSQDTSKVVNSLLKPAQVNDAETSSPSSSLSNVSIRSIKMSPFLKNSSCNVHPEKQESGSDSGNKKGKEDTSLKPTCPNQQGEPPDSMNSPPNKSTPALYHKSNLMTARTFLQPDPSPAPSSNKPSYQGDSKANSSHCSPLRQEQTLLSLSEGASSNGTSTKQKGPAAASREPTAENDNAFYGMEKRQSPGQGKLDLLSPYNQVKRDKKPVVPCYDKLTEDMLMEKNSAYGAEKRMTLGHSKLDLITKYNKLKSKHIHSRFEL